MAEQEIITISSDEDEAPKPPPVRPAKRPGEDHGRLQPKRPRLNDAGTSISAPTGLAGKGKARDTSLPQRPAHRPSASSSSVHTSPKKTTVQRTLSSTFRPLSKVGQSNQRDDSPNSSGSSSSDALPPPSTAYNDLYNDKSRKPEKPTSGHGFKPRSFGSASAFSSSSKAPRMNFPGDKVKPRASSGANSSISAPLRPFTSQEIIELSSGDEDPKPSRPFKARPRASSSTQRKTSGPSQHTTSSGVAPTPRVNWDPNSSSNKAGPSTKKPTRAKSKASSSSSEVEFITVPSDDELLLTPNKGMPSETQPTNTSPSPIRALPTSTVTSTSGKTSVGSAPKLPLPSENPLRRNLFGADPPSTCDVTMDFSFRKTAPSTQVAGSSNISVTSDQASKSATTLPREKDAEDTPMADVIPTTAQQTTPSTPPRASTSAISGSSPFGRPTLLLQKSPERPTTPSTSAATLQKASGTPLSSPTKSPRSPFTIPPLNVAGVGTIPSTSTTPAEAPSKPQQSARPAHGRKSSADVRKEITGIQDAIGAMGIEASASSDSAAPATSTAKSSSKPQTSKPVSPANRDDDFGIPENLLPLSSSASSSRPSTHSTPPKKRALTAAQVSVTPIYSHQPTSLAATKPKKPSTSTAGSSKPPTPAIPSGNVRSGELDLGALSAPAPLIKLPTLIAFDPSPGSQKHLPTPSTSASTTAAGAGPSQSQTTAPSKARPPLPSRSSLNLSGLSLNPTPKSAEVPKSQPGQGPFSWKPKNKDGDTVTDVRPEVSSLTTPKKPSVPTPSGSAVPASNVPPRVENNNETRQDTTVNRSAIASGVLDIFTQPQAPVAPPVLVPGNIPSSPQVPDVSSPPLPFLRDVSSPLSQSDPGPPSSRSPSVPNPSSPELNETAGPSRGFLIPSSPAESSSGSSRSDSSERSSESRLRPASRIARKSTGKMIARKSIFSQPTLPMTPEASQPRPRKLIARKTISGQVPSSLRQVEPSSDHESEYNAATSSAAEDGIEDGMVDEEGRRSRTRKARRTKNLVQSDSDSEQIAVQSSLIDEPDATSSNEEQVQESSSEPVHDGPRGRPRRKAAKTTSYAIPDYDQLPSSQPNAPVEPEAQPLTSWTKISAEEGEEEDDLPIVTKSYGGFQVLSWAVFRKDPRNISIKTFFNKDLPTRLQDQINSWPDFMKQQKDLVTLLRATIIEHTAEDEPDAPAIEIINEIDFDPTPPWEFYYSNHMWYGDGVEAPDVGKLKGCGCIGKCDPSSMACACVRRQFKYMPEYQGGFKEPGFQYDPKGRLRFSEQWPIFECNSLCGCDDDCSNRVVQNGRKVSLHLQKTKNKGWGVFAGAKKIPQGTFVGIYAGELITNSEGDKRGKNYDKFGRTYLLDIDCWHITHKDYLNLDVSHTIDAFHAGNFTRFLNHSCDPNCFTIPVYINETDIRTPLITLFTSREVKPYEELCFSYYGAQNEDEELSQLSKVTENDAMFLAQCQCGADGCRGLLWRMQ